MKSLQAIFERRLLSGCTLIHQILYQLHTSKNSGDHEEADKESPSAKHSPLWYKSTTGRKCHVQGNGLREGGFWTAWIQDFRCFQVKKKVQDPLHTTGRKDALSADGRAVILGDSQVPVWAPGTHSHRAFLPHTPDSSSLCPHLHRAHEVIRGRLS